MDTSPPPTTVVTSDEFGEMHFLNGSGFGNGPTQVRITAFDGTASGATLLDTLPEVRAELEVNGHAQFQ